MNRKASVVCLLAVFTLIAFALPAAGQDAPRLETVLAADADMVVVIEDMGALREGWSTSPWGRLWRDPGFGSLRDSLNTGLDKALGKGGLEALLDLVQGQVALVVDFDYVPGASRPDASISLVADFRNAEALNSLHETLDRLRDDDAGDERTATVNGVIVRTRISGSGEDKDTWAFAGGIGVLGTSEDHVKRQVEALTGKGEGPRLASSTGFRSMQKQAPRADVSMILHVAELAQVMTRAMEMEMEENPGTAMMGLTAQDVSRALALDSIDAAYVAWNEEERETVFYSGLLYQGDKGITGLLAYLPGPCERPAFIPQTAWMASSSRFSMAGMYRGLMTMLSDLNPGMAMMAKAQLEQLTMAYGLDLEADLLGNLGENAFGAYLPGSGNTAPWDQIFGIEIKDPQRIDEVLAAIYTSMGVTGEPEAVDRVGDVSIFALFPPGSEQSIYYALSGQRLIVCNGGANSLVGILKGMQSPGPSIWNRSDVKQYLDRLPRDPCAIVYYDVPSLYEMTFAAVREQETAPPGFSGMPDADTFRRYFGTLVGGDYKTDEGMLAVGYIQHVER